MPYRYNSLPTLACLVALLQAACDGPGSEFDGEVLRVASSDSVADAVMTVSASGGATVSSMFFVSIVPAGAAPGNDDVFRADRVRGDLKVCWSDLRDVQIRVDSAQIWHFQNFDYMRSADDSLLRFRVRLVEGWNSEGVAPRCSSLAESASRR